MAPFICDVCGERRHPETGPAFSIPAIDFHCCYGCWHKVISLHPDLQPRVLLGEIFRRSASVGGKVIPEP